MVCLSLVPTISKADNWIIDNGKVYINDSKAYISQYPDTISKDSTIELEYGTKEYTGYLTIALGVDNQEMSPTGARYVFPHIRRNTAHYHCEGRFEYTTDPKYFWCYDSQTDELVFEHSFETGDLGEKTAYWIETRIGTYLDISQEFKKISYDYGGMNTWYYIKDIPVTAGEIYEIMVDMDLQSGISDGKYWWCAWPSSMGIAEARSSDNLYCLDPWVGNATFSGYYPINSSMPADGCFVINDTDIGTQTVIYARNQSNLDVHCANEGCVTGSIAVGNDTAETYWEDSEGGGNEQGNVWYNASNVFRFENRTDDPSDDSSQYDNDCDFIGNPQYNDTHSVHGRSLYFDGSGDGCAFPFTMSGASPQAWSIELWYYGALANPQEPVLAHNGITDGWHIRTSSSAWGDVYFETCVPGCEGKVTTTSTMSTEAWYYIVVRHNQTHNSIFFNGVNEDEAAVATHDSWSNANNPNIGIANNDNSTRALQGNIDEFMVWERQLSPEEIQRRYENGISGTIMSNLDSWIVSGGGGAPDTNVRIYVWDENDAFGGTFTNITFNLTLTNSTDSQTWTNIEPNFDQNVSTVPSGVVTATVSSYGYYTRIYQEFIPTNNVTRRHYYLPTTTPAILTRFYVVNTVDSAISGATIQVTRFINDTWTEVAEMLTDSGGVANVYLNPTGSYRLNVTASGYNDFNATITPSSEYKITMTESSSAAPVEFSTENVTMYMFPTSTGLNATTNIPFNCSVFAHDSGLEYMVFSISGYNGTSYYYNQSSTTDGDFVEHTMNLIGENGTNLTATCGFKRVGFAWVNTTRRYYIYNVTRGAAERAVQSANETMGTLEMGIVSIIITILVMGWVMGISNNGLAAAVVGLAMMGLFSFWFRWLDTYMFLLMAFTTVAVVLVRRRGGF